jgi:hypothetical protein
LHPAQPGQELILAPRRWEAPVALVIDPERNVDAGLVEHLVDAVLDRLLIVTRQWIEELHDLDGA